MNKKLLALAIAAALAPAAAMADSGNVKISGSVHMSVDSLNGNSSQTGTDNDREMNISSNNSYINFSGDEDLGNGLKAIWQLSSVVGMGDTSTPAGGNAWTSGVSYLGLTGGFGTTVMGRLDTPMKAVGRKVDLFADQIGDARNLTNNTDTGAGFDLRVNNAIAYVSPSMGGFVGTLAYVTNVDAGAAEWNSITALSASGVYEAGPAMVGLAYEKHNLSNLNNGTTVTGVQDEKAWRLAGGYSFGDVKVVALFQKTSDLGGTNRDRKTWGLGAGYKMGATTIKGQYYNAGDLSDCGTVDCGSTGAKMYVLGADYSLSKRTTAYVAYAKTNNDSGATAGTGAAFSAFGGGHGDNPGTVAGKDPSGFSLGMKHSF